MLKIKSHCNSCGNDTNHIVQAQYINRGDHETEFITISWTDDWKIIQCAGCDSISTRVEHSFSEVEEVDIVLYPPAISRRKPLWLESSEFVLDETLENLFHELYIVAQADARFLTTIACRTIIERIMTIKLKGRDGTFKDRLIMLESEGFISKSESKLINTVIEAGNASSHRGWSPKKSQEISTLIGIIENLVERVFILEHQEKELKKKIPKRKTTKKVKSKGLK